MFSPRGPIPTCVLVCASRLEPCIPASGSLLLDPNPTPLSLGGLPCKGCVCVCVNKHRLLTDKPNRLIRGIAES